MQWTGVNKSNCVIHWVKIYSVDSTIHLLNNWGLIPSKRLVATGFSFFYLSLFDSV